MDRDILGGLMDLAIVGGGCVCVGVGVSASGLESPEVQKVRTPWLTGKLNLDVR